MKCDVINDVRLFPSGKFLMLSIKHCFAKAIALDRVLTSSVIMENHKKSSMHGKIMEFETKIIMENHGIL